MALAALFLAALVAATPLPMQSEAVLLAVLASGTPVFLAVAVASFGNVLGAVLTYFLARHAARLPRVQGWLRTPSPGQVARFHAWGQWTLLLSWVPVFGDAMVILAGLLRLPLWRFLLLVGVAKTGRYAAVAGLFQVWFA